VAILKRYFRWRMSRPGIKGGIAGRSISPAYVCSAPTRIRFGFVRWERYGLCSTFSRGKTESGRGRVDV